MQSLFMKRCKVTVVPLIFSTSLIFSDSANSFTIAMSVSTIQKCKRISHVDNLNDDEQKNSFMQQLRDILSSSTSSTLLWRRMKAFPKMRDTLKALVLQTVHEKELSLRARLFFPSFFISTELILS